MKENKLTTFGGFIVFALAYYLPLFAGFDVLSIKDGRAQALLSEALSQTPVVLDVAVNVGTHLGLLLASFVVAILAARGLQRFIDIRYGIALTLALMSLFATLATLNAALFPKSGFNIVYAAMTHPVVGIVAFSCLSFFALAASCHIVKRHYAPLLVAAAVSMISFSAFQVGQVVGKTPPGAKPRNVIIIGIDSLSRDALVRYEKDLPAISALYDAAIVVPGALTPLARTFPAWITTLSGQPPAVTGAYFNLTEISDVQKAGLLSQALKQQGYQTIFAIDERRFCNIDETYGFDQVVGPKPGVLDFALQGFNEMPLTNLLLQAGLGRYLLKHSYMNTASYVNYDEDAIIREIGRAIDGRPLFLAVHFESSHFPFKTRFDERGLAGNNRFFEAYMGTLQVVNRQVSALMALLHERALLDDTLLVLMSDHGESLGEVENVVAMSPEPLVVKGFGHGNNLLSQQEHNIVLGFLHFVNGAVAHAPSVVEGPVSLNRVRPTIDGFVHNGNLAIEPDEGCIALETGLRFNAVADYRTIDREQLLEEVLPYYRIAQEGRVLINPRGLPELIATKDVAVRCKERFALYRRHTDDVISFELKQGTMSLSPPDSATLAALETYRAQLLNFAGLPQQRSHHPPIAP